MQTNLQDARQDATRLAAACCAGRRTVGFPYQHRGGCQQGRFLDRKTVIGSLQLGSTVAPVTAG